MSKSVRRRGFTLPEVLVTITIVAVLAAVVVPAVLNQVNKGDTAGLAGDVGALRTAISNFTTDTRHYPASIEDLISPIDAGDFDITGTNTYGAAAANAWKGPYFPTSQSISGTGTYSTTAFNLAIENDLDIDGDFITISFADPASGTHLSATLATIDRLFDGGDGTLPSEGVACATTATDGSGTGSILWAEAGTPCEKTALKWRLLSAAQ
jgi:prepilin-type N-terminal cleavage/methylation domain-containing protein